jgi:hypothetical protein
MKRYEDRDAQHANKEPTFANFTFAEWVEALIPVFGEDGAREYAKNLFDTIARDGSNGYSLSMEFWALLARLGGSASARVAQMTQNFPDECLREIAAIRRAWDSRTR